MPASVPAPPLPSPEARYRKMGDYLLLERIAAGGMGEVWLAKRKNDEGVYGELRALKFLHKEQASKPEIVSMFVEEARLASRLDHASVARLYELGRDEDTYYIAMEHLFGRDLLTVLRRARDRGLVIPAPLVALIGMRVAEALDAARHATAEDGSRLEIVHRDVSPQNIVLGFDGRVKLIDFGIARAENAAKPHDPSAKVHGKLGYVSPEQAQGLAVDHRSDQFSLGICLWELLVLRPLFRRQSDVATLDDVVRARVPPVRSKRPDCPAELAAIVGKMLQKEPDDRFGEAADVAAALKSFSGRSADKAERQDLVSFVRKLFEDEYMRDRMRFDALELVGKEVRPGSGDVTPPHGLPAALAQSLASTSLFDDDDPHEQATMIFPDAGPMAARSEREVFFRRDSIPERSSRPSDPNNRGPVHATFRPGRAGAAEVWRPPASDLIESVAAFEDPALAEERDEASFEVTGAFHGRNVVVSEPPAPPVSQRPSSRPPPSDLPTRSELAHSELEQAVIPRAPKVPNISVYPLASPLGPASREPTPTSIPAPPPKRQDTTPRKAREATQPTTTPTRKLASIPPPPEPTGNSLRPWLVLVVALLAIGAATYAAFRYLGL